MKKEKNVISIAVIVFYSYIIIFALSTFFLRKYGYDYMSYVYMFNFVLLVIITFCYSFSLIVGDLGSRKLYTYIVLVFTFLIESFLLMVIYFFFLIAYDMGTDVILYEGDKPYVQSDKYTCAGMHKFECTEREGYVNFYLKKIRKKIH